MKKLTRKLFISILAAVFAVVALGTSTFAWITISNTATVNAFEGLVEAGDSGIELRLEGKNWTNSLTLESADINQYFHAFADITSDDGINFNEYIITEGAKAEKQTVKRGNSQDGKFIEFDLQIRNPNKNAEGNLNVYVEDSKVEFHTINDSGQFTSDVKPAIDDQSNVMVSNAARMSFDSDWLKNQQESESADRVAIVYEQNVGGNQTEGSNSNDGNTIGFSEDGFAYQYLIKKGFKPFTNTEEGNLPDISGVTSDILKKGSTRKAGTTGKVQVIQLTDDYKIGHITVRVWVEGWDNECHHNILSQSLSTKFSLSSEPVK